MQKKTTFYTCPQSVFFSQEFDLFDFQKYDYMLVRGEFSSPGKIGFLISFHKSCLNFSKQLETIFAVSSKE